MSVSHRGDRLVQVVEDDHAIIEREAEVGQLAVVGRRVWQPLDVAHRIVGRVPHRAAAETRQAGQIRCAVIRQFLFEQFQRIGMIALESKFLMLACASTLGPRVVLSRLNPHVIFVGLKTQKWSGTEKAVPPQSFAADHALEEKGPVAFLNLAESADRRQRVADQLTVDRHHAGITGQLGILFVARSIAHGGLGFMEARPLDATSSVHVLAGAEKRRDRVSRFGGARFVRSAGFSRLYE